LLIYASDDLNSINYFEKQKAIGGYNFYWQLCSSLDGKIATQK
jgi:hypothetical protein